MISSRRHIFKASACGISSVVFGSLLGGCGGGGADLPPTSAPLPAPLPAPVSALTPPSVVQPTSGTRWVMRDEGDVHQATWMAFAASTGVWGSRLRGPVQDTLARIANAIVQFEPVNMLVSAQDLPIARQKCDSRVNLLVREVDDLWLRDTGPVFVKGPNGEKAGVNFNFNGWGGKQAHAKDAGVADFITQRVGAQRLSTKLVLEGGGIEVDGNGTAIITESCVLNPNRNPGLTKLDCEHQLGALLGVRKVIWLPGIVGKDITDGHTDFYARFAHAGVVAAAFDGDPQSFDHAVTKRHLEILQSATDADNKRLQIVTLETPKQTRPEFAGKDFAAGYVNFYLANKSVFMPEFGDPQADALAKQRMTELFPDRVVVQINIDPIAAGGGGIHCTTQQEPA